MKMLEMKSYRLKMNESALFAALGLFFWSGGGVGAIAPQIDQIYSSIPYLISSVSSFQLGRYVEAGATSIDMADHYGSAELIVGEYIKQQGGTHENIQVFTKWVPKPGKCIVSSNKKRRPVLDSSLLSP